MGNVGISRKKSDFDYAAYFREARLLHDLTMLPQDKRWRSAAPAQTEPHSVVLYLGCNILRTSHMIRTMMDILDLLDVDYVAVGGAAYCCGVVHHHHGDTEIAQTVAHNTVRFLERFEPERVVMWCPGCIFFYDEVCRVPASFETQHPTEFLAEHLGDLRFVREVRQRVALHYHCSQPRRLAEARAAEALLMAVPGLEYVRIDSDTRLGRNCPPDQKALGMETWQGIIQHQLAQARADIFATLYHGCQRLICVYEERYPAAIEHYLTVFARALGIEHEDKYKRYRLWRDPERVLKEMAPCMRANGIPLDRARRVVSRTFPKE